MTGLENEPDNFGIEQTMDVDMGNAGSQELLKDLLSPETSTASPEGVVSIEEAKAKEKADKAAADKVEADKIAAEKAKAGEGVPPGTAKDPEALTNFLLGDETNPDETDEEKVIREAAEAKALADKEAAEANPNGDEGNEEEEEGTIAFDALSNELFNLGVFNKAEGEEDVEITDAEGFLERFNTEKQKGANEMIQNFLGQFGQEHQDAFQAIYVNGVNPRDYFTKQASVEDFKSMDLKVEKNQEKVIRKALENQGFEAEDVDSEIARLKNYGDLEDVSKKHHKVLVKNEEKELQDSTAQAQRTQQIKAAEKNEYVKNVRDVLTEKLKTKAFDGIPLNNETANELQDFLLVDKWKTDSGETLTDFDKTILELKKPENHATKVKVALLLRLLEKDPTLSTIQKSGVSKKTSALFKDVARQKTTAARKTAGNKNEATTSWFK